MGAIAAQVQKCQRLRWGSIGGEDPTQRAALGEGRPANIELDDVEVGVAAAATPETAMAPLARAAPATEVLAYIARGRSATFIADELHISPHTVKTHSKRIHEKLGLGSKEDIISLIETGITART